MTKMFARGLNFMGQLGIKNGKNNLAHFQEIPSLSNKQVIQVEAHLSQSTCLLDDGQILNWGWVFDSLTTARTLSYYKRSPKLAKFWQKYSFLGPTLGMRSGIDEPSLLNKTLVFKQKPVKISLGGSYLLCLTSNYEVKDSGEAYATGENYKGQLGTGDINFKFNFCLIDKRTAESIVDISAGFQHSLYLASDGSCFASGRTNWRQFLPYFQDAKEKEKFIDFYRDLKKIILPGEKIIKVSAGFSHSLFYTSKNKLYAIGLNNFGQCGQSSLNQTQVSDYKEVFLNFEPDEEIVELKAGKSHNIFLTNKGRVFGFGATSHNQLNWKNEVGQVCSPKEIVLPLQDEKVVKIKCTLDRNAAITDKGNCYVWGGENYESIGGEANIGIQNLRETVPGNNRVKDVGLGFMHTLVLTEA